MKGWYRLTNVKETLEHDITAFVGAMPKSQVKWILQS
jgi:hypothetical protein